MLDLPPVYSPTGYWSLGDYTPEEIAEIARKEDVIHLDDLILRRTMIGKLGQLTERNLADLAGVVAEAIGWSTDFQQSEIERTVELMADQHGVDLNHN